MLFVTQYTQLVAGLSPFPAGLVMLPGVLAMMAGLLAAPLLARRTRPANLIATGLALSVIGLLVLTAVDVTGYAGAYASADVYGGAPPIPEPETYASRSVDAP